MGWCAPRLNFLSESSQLRGLHLSPDAISLGPQVGRLLQRRRPAAELPWSAWFKQQKQVSRKPLHGLPMTCHVIFVLPQPMRGRPLKASPTHITLIEWHAAHTSTVEIETVRQQSPVLLLILACCKRRCGAAALRNYC